MKAAYKHASRKPAAARPVTADSLQAAAANYITRFDASTDRVRRVLQRRVRNARFAGASVPDDVESIIEELLRRYVSMGILDDTTYAQRRAESLRRRGESRHRISQHLARAGIDRESAAHALTAADDTSDTAGDRTQDAELEAAIRFARRRRLGPYRKDDRAANRNRDLAALGRAGFEMALARRIVDSADPDDLA